MDEIDKQGQAVCDQQVKVMKRIASRMGSYDLIKSIWRDHSEDALQQLLVELIHDTPKSDDQELSIQLVEALLAVPEGKRVNHRWIAITSVFRFGIEK